MSGIKRTKLTDGSISYGIRFDWQGAEVFETSGKDLRVARRLLAHRRREVADGSYQPPVERKVTTIGQWGLAWAERRTTGNARAELSVLKRLVLSREWFANLPIGDWRVRHTMQLIAELRATKINPEARRANQAGPDDTLSEKYIRNVYGLVRTMCGAARIAEVLLVDACLIPKRTLRGGKKKRPEIYRPEEVLALTTEEAVSPEARVFCAIAFYCGNREGEICAYRWKRYDAKSKPLGCLACVAQYNDQALKTGDEEGECARMIPVHPELAHILDAWWREGWAEVYGRKPTPEDRIVPSFGQGTGRIGATPRHRTLGTHTKSSAYKLWRRACVAARVDNRSLHSTRHTMITATRRGGAMPDHLELVTHNAAGTILDNYTHLGWDPVCEALLCLRYTDAPRVTSGPQVVINALALAAKAAAEEATATGDWELVTTITTELNALRRSEAKKNLVLIKSPEQKESGQ